MDLELTPSVIVNGPPTTTVIVMGVSGSGKTTIAQALVRRLDWPYAEGDDFHPTANVEKMRSGHPLDDEDRWPWLRAIATWIGEREHAGQNAIVTCSALKLAYRDLLRQGHDSVWFAHVTADAEVILQRMKQRRGHYMPPSLLGSQFAILEQLQPDEPGATVVVDDPATEVADRIVGLLEKQRAIGATALGGN